MTTPHIPEVCLCHYMGACAEQTCRCRCHSQSLDEYPEPPTDPALETECEGCS